MPRYTVRIVEKPENGGAPAVLFGPSLIVAPSGQQAATWALEALPPDTVNARLDVLVVPHGR